jgi:dipeptidyl aminopeptidase/acylaminoacyl peptidase
MLPSAFQMATRLFISCASALVLWVALVHTAQPLPNLFFADNDSLTLHLWSSDCPSLLQTCSHTRRLLDGLNLHPVAQPSPDGEFVAVYLSEMWVIYPMDCLLGDQRCTPAPLDSDASDNRVTWGIDGSILAYLNGQSPTTMTLQTRGCWQRVEDCWTGRIQVTTAGALRQPSWSADGERFAFLGLQPDGLFLLDSACLDIPDTCADQLEPLLSIPRPAYWPTLSGDGEQLLYYVESPLGVGELYLTDMQSGSTRRLPGGEGGSYVPAWSPDKRYIAYAGFQRLGSGDLSIFILDMERNLTVRGIAEPGHDFNYPAWSPRT